MALPTRSPKAKEEAEWRELVEEAEMVFKLVCALESTGNKMSKKGMMRCLDGQYDTLFEQIDTDKDKWVTLPEWQAFLTKTKAEKGAGGQKWMATVLHTMSQNLKEMYHKPPHR